MTDPSPFEGIDVATLSEWMDEQGLPGGPIEAATRLGGGTQNILIRFERGGDGYVLRRPPPHKRKNSDETMRREARFLAALEGSDVPHPRLIAACADEGLLGAAFYLMEPIDGFNPTTGLPALHASDPAIRHRMGLSMVDGIAALGSVDHVAVGVADLGKAEGFLARQVPRWQAHLEGYASFESYPGPEIPGLDAVATWLEAHRPPENPAGILHGDFHLANVLFEPDGPELAAIVDWELCTIGDPLLDLGWMLATWPDGSAGPAGGMRIEPWEGFPEAHELVARYGERSERSVDAAPWFEVLACFKLGIILEGTHARACAGKAPKPIGDALHATTLGLFERAQRRISGA